MKRLWFFAASAVFFLTSCDREETTKSDVNHENLLSGFFTSVMPDEAKAIHQVRADVAPGDDVTIHGMVMGRGKPIVEGRAAFVLGDRTILTPCNEKEDDQCPTPWDVCCDSSEDKQRGTATIQLLGDDGRVIAASIRGVEGLKELSKVTLKGRVAEGSGAEVLVVNATEIHVHP